MTIAMGKYNHTLPMSAKTAVDNQNDNGCFASGKDIGMCALVISFVRYGIYEIISRYFLSGYQFQNINSPLSSFSHYICCRLPL